MQRRYQYVGPHNLLMLLDAPVHHQQIQQAQDISAWMQATHQKLSQTNEITATFIIDTTEQLWIADQHSEHVVCARGAAVLTAGEITFEYVGDQWSVTAITNQSTGYCPEPTSWPMVVSTLARIGLSCPAYWTNSYIFRLCSVCKTINIVKDAWFECAVCEQPLSQTWNFAYNA